MLKNIVFVNPEFFLLLLLLPAVGVWYYQRYRQHYAPISMPTLQAFKGNSSLRGRLRSLLPGFRALAFVSIVIALARPQQLLKESDIQAEGIDIMLAMDLSSSMLAQDFKPDNRLEVSKQVAADFVDKRPYDRIGLVVFSGEAFTQCPLTTDHAVVKQFLDGLECGFLEDGTAIGMGLATAVNRIKDSPVKSKIVILLTDGVNNAGYIKPELAADIARQFNVKVYTVGIGSTGDALSPISRGSDGRYIYGLVPVEIDEALLQDIAKGTGGRYFRAKNARDLRDIYDIIDRLERSKIDVTTIKRRSEAFFWFAFAGMSLLILELVLRYTVFRTIP